LKAIIHSGSPLPTLADAFNTGREKPHFVSGGRRGLERPWQRKGATLNRRDFLKITPAVVGAGVSAAVHAHEDVLVVPATTPAPGVIEVGNDKQLFLDDWLIASKTRVSRYMSCPEKSAKNPLIVADKPWERENPGAVRLPLAGVQICGQTVIYDKEEQIFKMWYNPYAFFEGKVRPWCYAVS